MSIAFLFTSRVRMREHVLCGIDFLCVTRRGFPSVMMAAMLAQLMFIELCISSAARVDGAVPVTLLSPYVWSTTYLSALSVVVLPAPAGPIIANIFFLLVNAATTASY